MESSGTPLVWYWRSTQHQVRHCPEYNALLDMHNDLCNALPINDLFRALISRQVVNIFDKKKLCLNRIEQEISELFLEDHLHPQLLAGDTKKFYDFVSAMKESDKCKFLVKKLQEQIAFYESCATRSATGTYVIHLYRVHCYKMVILDMLSEAIIYLV